MLKRLYIDTETTGTDYKIHGIHQISGYIEINGEILETFDYKVKPFDEAIFDEKALEISNTTLEQILTYESEIEIYKKFSEILFKYLKVFDKTDRYAIVGYNVKFDKDFLHEFFKRQGDEFFFNYVWSIPLDVSVIAFEFLEAERYKMEHFNLMYVAEYLGIELNPEKAHQAIYDIEITREVLLLINQKKINNQIDNLFKNNIGEFNHAVYKTEEKENLKTWLDDKTLIKENKSKLEDFLFLTENELNESEIIQENNVKSYLDSIMDDFDAVIKKAKTTHNVDLKKVVVYSDNFNITIPDNKIVETNAIKEIISEPKDIDSTFVDTFGDIFLNKSPEIFLEKKIPTNTNKPSSMRKINSLEDIMTFGCYSNWTFYEIMKENPGYIKWLHDGHINGIFVSVEILNEAILKSNDKKYSRDYNTEYRDRKKNQNDRRFEPRKGFEPNLDFDNIEKMSSFDASFGDFNDDLPF